jgi:hypothetical protein
VAASIRKELGVDVEKVHGHYGELKVLVDNQVVVDGGAGAMFGIMPSKRTILAVVRERLTAAPGGTGVLLP